MSEKFNKRSYHPFVWVAFYLQILPEELLRTIPKSTTQYRRNTNEQALFGYNWYQQNKHLADALTEIAQSKKLLRINLLLLRVIALRRFIIQYKSELKERRKSHVSVVLGHIDRMTEHMTLQKCLYMLQLDRKELYRMRNLQKCRASALGLCSIKHPAQLLRSEVAKIKTYLLDTAYSSWPLIAIYHQMRRQSDAVFSRNTFYRYVHLLDIKRQKPSHRRMKHEAGIKASRPLELLHIDVTRFRLADHSKAYIYLVRDNFSRAILHVSASMELRASHWKEALKTVFEQYSITHPCTIMSDGGSENGGVGLFLDECRMPFEVRHLVAQADTHFSNSMAEAGHYLLKYYGLYHCPIHDFNDLKHWLPIVQLDYLQRPHDVLNGMTPKEVLHGVMPGSIFISRPNSMTAAQRMIENKRTMCCYSF
jgi:transposase InsO family protein